MLIIVASFLLLAGVFLLIKQGLGDDFFDKGMTWQKERAKKSSKSLEDSFIFIDQKKLIVLYVIMPLILGGLGFFLFKIVGVLFGLCLGLFIPPFLKNVSVKRRQKKCIHSL